MAPLIFASQQQFSFSHIVAGATAYGKVSLVIQSHIQVLLVLVWLILVIADS